MELRIESKNSVEKIFESLAADEKIAIISHGMTFYLSSLKKRLFYAKARIRDLESKYKRTLAQIDSKGLPDDADIEMHEDYIMWHHWQDTVQKVEKKIRILDAEMIGLYTPEALNVSE